MQISRTAVAAALITSFFLFSCEAPFDFEEPEEKSVSLQVETVVPGSFLSPGDAVTVSLALLEGDVAPSRIDFSLESEKGSSRASSSFELDGSDSLPDLEIPRVEPGLYVLESSVYDAEETLLQRESVRFFIVDDEYAIRRISTLPVSVEPDSEVILFAAVEAPAEARPYLVWRMGDKIIYEGTVTSGTVKARWRSPEVEGVYSLKAELFPFQPYDLDDFHSQEALETDVYVSRSTTALKGDIGPAEHYADLFHLRGNYNDGGYAGSGGVAEEIGNPLFDVRDSLYGLSLEGSSGVVFSGIEPLVFGEHPFSTVIRMLVSAETEAGRLLRFSNASGDTVFALDIDRRGELRGRFDAAGLAEDIPSGIFPAVPGGPITMILSAYPADEGIEWIWYQDGRLTGRHRSSNAPDGTVSSLELGGDRGVTGIIDELGIHTRDDRGRPGAFENPFAKGSRERYGSAVRYAEGFGEGEKPSDIAVQGSVRFTPGRVHLDPKGSLLLPSLDAGGERVSLGLYFPEERGNLGIEYSFGEAEPAYRPVKIGNGGVTPDEDGFVWIDLSSEDAGAAGLSIRLENGSEEAPLVLGAIILLSERAELTGKTEPEEVSAIS
ncbi:MAG: hypothetical protein ACLFRY_10845 [Spirochaetia bacterium]